MSLNTKLNVSLSANFAKTADFTNPQHPLKYAKLFDWADGTGLDQANQLFADQRTLGASANEELDLAGGLTDSFGDTVTFTKIKGIIVFAAVANTNNVLIGGAATNGFNTWVTATGDEVVLRPGGIFVLTAPDATAYAVTAATGDLLRFENSAGGTGVTYDLVLIGTK